MPETDCAVAQFLSDSPRSKTIELSWPTSFDGGNYQPITMIRLTAGDVARLEDELEVLLRDNPDAALRFPIFWDETGAPVPEEVLDALDDDDRFELDRAAADFFPRQCLGIAEPFSGPGTGRTDYTPEISRMLAFEVVPQALTEIFCFLGRCGPAAITSNLVIVRYKDIPDPSPVFCFDAAV